MSARISEESRRFIVAMRKLGRIGPQGRPIEALIGRNKKQGDHARSESLSARASKSSDFFAKPNGFNEIA